MNKDFIAFNDVRLWSFVTKLAIGEKKVSIKDQAFLQGLDVVGIFTSGEAKTVDNNTLTNTGFYLNLQDSNDKQNLIPSKFLNFENEQIVSWGFNDIAWNKSEIIFPVNAIADTFVELVVLYRYKGKV